MRRHQNPGQDDYGKATFSECDFQEVVYQCRRMLKTRSNKLDKGWIVWDTRPIISEKGKIARSRISSQTTQQSHYSVGDVDTG